MKRTLIAATAAFALNTLALVIIPAYRYAAVDLGGLFVRSTDIADIPKMTLVGFILVSALSILLGIGLERVVRSVSRRSTTGV